MAKRPTHELAFTALRLEGGLLAPDFLDKVAHLEASEQSEADYDIPRGLKLRDEIGRYWKIAQNLWHDFDTARARTDLDQHIITADNFLEPFCRQVLGMTDLKAVGQITLDERLFPIGYAALEGHLPAVFAAHNRELDKPSSRHGDGTRRRSPFLLAQEFLNAEEQCLWAVVSNGLKLRILRDNPSLTRPAYIEADLESIFTEGLYPDFTALWLLAHGTRFGKSDAEATDCPLERWRNTAQEEGIRVRDRLRNGVTIALRSLGTGFLAHAANAPLRHKIESGALSTHALFEQLLRLVYRFIFLATIEDRELVFAPDASLEAKHRYQTGYSLARLRKLAARRRSYDRHSDLWQILTITFAGLGKGQAALGLPALGGLFDVRQCPDLDGAQLDNQALLSAIFSLCFFRDDATLSRVNYRDMDSEELGSVYESLLELVPIATLTGGARSFSFIGDDEAGSTKGNARKLTGSYYTPDSLVQELIKSALEPVIEQTIKTNPQDPVKALLSLTVCDPACGSGHFLLAAARRIAEDVARLNASDGNPTPEDYRHALRDVVAHCLYGVDKNPMAIELSRTALWLEAYTPDRPLTFLEHHLRCGDALLGVLDPAIMEEGIPDKAFDALSGDDKDVVKALKKANREARKSIEKIRKSGPQHAFGFQPATTDLDLDALPDDTLEAIETKRAAFILAETAAAHSRERIASDLFVAAFVLPKTKNTQNTVPTSQDVYLQLTGSAPRTDVVEAATAAAHEAQAFHWWQAFPQVQLKGGFDVLLGNPPWDMLQLDPQEYFANRAPSIANAKHMAARDKLIEGLKEDNPKLCAEYRNAVRVTEATQAFIHESGRYPASGFGRLNLAYLFAELFLDAKSPHGRAGFLVPSGIATDSFSQHLFNKISDGNLVSLTAFENEEFVFRSVHHSFRFCIVTLGRSSKAEFVFFARNPAHIHDVRRRFSLSHEEFRLINPNTATCPVFRSQQDAELTKKIYRDVPIFVKETELGEDNPWDVKFMLMFMMNTDSRLFIDMTQEGHVPLYEGKMVHQYDHRWATYDQNGESRDVSEQEKTDPGFTVTPRYWVEAAEVKQRLADKEWDKRWLMGWRDVTSAHVLRTVIATVIPWSAVGNNFPLMLFSRKTSVKQQAALFGNLCALVFDFTARHMVGGNHLNFFIYKQLPVLSPARYEDDDITFIAPRVLELTFTAHDLKHWAEDLGFNGPPFIWNPERRALLRAELDAYYAKLYGLTRDELRYILDPADVMGDDYPSETFRVLKNNELKQFGEYRTQRLVLEAWDRLSAAETLGKPYFCPLVPPPGVPAEPVWSDQGIIHNPTEGRYAGILYAAVRLSGSISLADLQSTVNSIGDEAYLAAVLDASEMDRYKILLNASPGILDQTIVSRLLDFLGRLERAGCVCVTRQGDMTFYNTSDAPLPNDVLSEPGTDELAKLLIAAQTRRKVVLTPQIAPVPDESEQQQG